MIYMICGFWNILYFFRYFSTTCFQSGSTEKGLCHFSFPNVFPTFWNLGACLPFRKFHINRRTMLTENVIIKLCLSIFIYLNQQNLFKKSLSHLRFDFNSSISVWIRENSGIATSKYTFLGDAKGCRGKISK